MAFLVLALFASALIPRDEALQYVLYKKAKKWDDASSHCRDETDNGGSWGSDEKAGQLATWNNVAEWKRIVALHVESGSHLGTWVGLNDKHWGPLQEGNWMFVDGSWCGGNCKNLDQWAPGEPNNRGDEDCAEISTGMGNRLNDVNCNRKYWFVCEFPDEDGDDKVADAIPFVPQLPHPDGPVNVPGTQFVFDFASDQKGMVIVALAAFNVIWMAIAVYYCCQFRKRKGKEPYSKVVQFSEEERLNAL